MTGLFLWPSGGGEGERTNISVAGGKKRKGGIDRLDHKGVAIVLGGGEVRGCSLRRGGEKGTNVRKRGPPSAPPGKRKGEERMRKPRAFEEGGRGSFRCSVETGKSWFAVKEKGEKEEPVNCPTRLKRGGRERRGRVSFASSRLGGRGKEESRGAFSFKREGEGTEFHQPIRFWKMREKEEAKEMSSMRRKKGDYF